jgi:hypothetical protein
MLNSQLEARLAALRVALDETRDDLNDGLVREDSAYRMAEDLSWLLSLVEELGADKKALIEGALWKVYHGGPSDAPQWMARHNKFAVFATADEALAAYRASSSLAVPPVTDSGV